MVCENELTVDMSRIEKIETKTRFELKLKTMACHCCYRVPNLTVTMGPIGGYMQPCCEQLILYFCVGCLQDVSRLSA